jgi:hypothetical protein
MATTTSPPISNPLIVQLGYLNSILKAQTADLSQEESLFQPPGGGNCINWLLGHILTSRNQMLELLDRPPIWGEEERARYAQGSPAITAPGSGVLEISRLLEDYEATQTPILEALATISDEDLAVKTPWFGGELDKSGVLGGFLFHEAYHVGQAGLTRRLLGKTSAVGG